MRCFMVCRVRRILFCDQIKDEEVSGACGVYKRGKKCIQGFGGESWGKRPLVTTQA